MSSATPEPRRIRSALAVGAACLLVGAAASWSVSTVMNPPDDVLSETPFTTVEVVDGEVGSSIRLNTAAEWTPVPSGTNRVAGTVTSIGATAGQSVGAGAVLYSVDLRPVAVAQGAVPAFRALAPGTLGADVQQLQTLLAELGFYRSTPDGRFEAKTTAATKAWQKSLGLTQDGVVQVGDIIFLPSLPVRVALDPAVVVTGAILGGGEAVLRSLPDAPDFTLPVTSSQSTLMPAGTRVSISAPDGGEWEAFVVAAQNDGAEGTELVLGGRDGALICADACGTVPVTGQTLLNSQVVTVESVSGLTVPSAALQSTAGGALSVTDADGVAHTVSVVASARGMSIVEGVAAGTRVRVPATGE